MSRISLSQTCRHAEPELHAVAESKSELIFAHALNVIRSRERSYEWGQQRSTLARKQSRGRSQEMVNG
jgi:hypothetical protein